MENKNENYPNHEEQASAPQGVEFEMNDEQREVFARIDRNAKTVSEATAVIELAGIVKGVKPAALCVYGEIDQEAVSRAGFYTVQASDGVFAISSNEETAINLADAFANRRGTDGNLTGNAHRIIGKLLGYPETSTEYFLRRSHTIYTDDELPIVIPRSSANTVDAYFHQIILSPDHYQEEIDRYSKPLQAAAQELTPHSYELLERSVRREQIRQKMQKYTKYLLWKKPTTQDQDERPQLFVD